MSLIHSLQFALDTDNTEVYQFLQFLDTYSNVSAENKSLEVQRLYAIRWCVLSQFLYDNRHHNFKLPEQLKFIVHFTDSTVPCSTSVHWYQSFYQVDVLSKQLLQAIIAKTGTPALGNKISKGQQLIFTEEEAKCCKTFLKQILDTLALLNLCLHIIDTACTSFKDQPVVATFKLRTKWLTVVCVWLRATLLNRESSIEGGNETCLLESFRMLQGCILLLRQETALVQVDEFISCMEKQLTTQMYLAGAKYYSEEGKNPQAVFLYKKAVQQGWKPTAQQEDDTIKQLIENAETIGDDVEEVALEVDQQQTKPEDLIKPVYFNGICKELIEKPKLKLRPCKQEKIDLRK